MARKPPSTAWQPGQSGNPAGRKPGSGEIGRLRAAIGERVPEILERMIEQALAGDVAAARLLLERAISPLKPSEQALQVPMPEGADLGTMARAVLDAVAKAEVPPTQGAALVAAIGQLAKVLETVELEARIKALEAANGKP